MIGRAGEGIDIGHGVMIWFATENGDPDGERVAIVEQHTAPDGSVCSGYAWFEGHAPMRSYPTWRVASMEPLTLEPSLLCSTCGHHGFIRDGKWVPA
jgi:hypothetical protein